MPEKLTEAQARRVCEALGRDPDEGMPVFAVVGGDAIEYSVGPVNWEIVQRAAEEEKP